VTSEHETQPSTGKAPPAAPSRLPKFAIFLVLIGIVAGPLLNAGYTTWAINRAHHQAQVEQQTAREQGEAVMRKLCVTLDKLHSDKPPAGDAATNPSRRYLQEQYEQLGELPGDIGC
jgi:hypothetical protein